MTAAVEDRKQAPGEVKFFPVIAGRGADESKEPMIAALLAGVSVLVLLIGASWLIAYGNEQLVLLVTRGRL